MSVHQDERRAGYWLVRWRQDGRQHTQRGFTSRRDAQDFDAAKRAETRKGAHGTREASRLRLDTWLDDWWARYSIEWEDGTQAERSQILNTWVVPYIGGVRLRDLGPAKIREWRARIVADGCTNNRANACMRVISTALTAAAREGRIPNNPCIGETAPKKLPHRVQPATVIPAAHVEAIRQTLTEHRDKIVVSLLAYAGLRPGELCALTWGDLTEHGITIDKAYAHQKIKNPKRASSRRVVPIIPTLAHDLTAWRAVYETLTGRHHTKDAPIVPPDREDVGQPYLAWGWWRAKRWQPANRHARHNDRPIPLYKPYDLRHTYASLLIHEGRPITQVAAWMGHASTTTTLKHYTHLIDEAALAPNQTMDAVIQHARNTMPKTKRSQTVPKTTGDDDTTTTRNTPKPLQKRTTGLEPATSSLGSSRSTS